MTITNFPQISSYVLDDMARAAQMAQQIADRMPQIPANVLDDMPKHESGHLGLSIGDFSNFDSHAGPSNSSRIEERVDQLEEELDHSRSETRSIREFLATGRTFNEGQADVYDDDQEQ